MDGLLADLREAERKLRLKSAAAPGVVEHADALARLAAAASIRPRVVLAGEINSGKTSLANLLLDQPVLPVGVLANTRRPMVLRHAEAVSVTGIAPDRQIELSSEADLNSDLTLERIEVGLPARRLRSFDLVDTPGLSEQLEIETLALRTSDVLVWCTPATQAWKESERSMWVSLPARHRRNAILVATHKDCLHGDGEVRQVRARLVAEAGAYFRSVVPVGCGGRAERQTAAEKGLAEFDRRLGESLAAISQRRIAAGYRIAGHIARAALALLEHGPEHGRFRRALNRRIGSRRQAGDRGDSSQNLSQPAVAALGGLGS